MVIAAVETQYIAMLASSAIIEPVRLLSMSRSQVNRAGSATGAGAADVHEAWENPFQRRKGLVNHKPFIVCNL